MSCGKTTVASHAYWGRSLGCGAIGEGRVPYYTKGKGYAYYNGLTFSDTGRSTTTVLC